MMRLSTLLDDMLVIPAHIDRNVEHLTLDSRRIGAHELFIALTGTRLKGSDFIPDAITQGATAVLVEGESIDIAMQAAIPIITIPNLSVHIAALAAKFFGYPAKKLQLFGVTGTNGKTSCTHFIAQSLQARQIPCGIIGTLGSGFYNQLGTAGLTTPDVITLHHTLSQFVANHAKAAALEVSSHSIHQNRIRDLEFSVGIFTNLTQDHLDYHGTMENYANVKHQFVAHLPVAQVVMNADDAYGLKWIHELAARKTLWPYSLKPRPEIKNLTYTQDVVLSLAGTKAQVISPWGEGQLTLPLVGDFNLSNALAVLNALAAVGMPFTDILQCLAELRPVPGRMQTLGGQGRPLVVVDYAHTPDALEKALRALRLHLDGKLWCLFGCGGDRDQGKRPLMANIAEKFADRVIVTSDNPRNEAPDAIAADILRGFTHPHAIQVELDRSKAIQKSIQCAATNDCILIAGKGAETYQQIGQTKIPFSDAAEVVKFLGDV